MPLHERGTSGTHCPGFARQFPLLAREPSFLGGRRSVGAGGDRWGVSTPSPPPPPAIERRRRPPSQLDRHCTNYRAKAHCPVSGPSARRPRAGARAPSRRADTSAADMPTCRHQHHEHAWRMHHTVSAVPRRCRRSVRHVDCEESYCPLCGGRSAAASRRMPIGPPPPPTRAPAVLRGGNTTR